jgi:acyl dehydratase
MTEQIHHKVYARLPTIWTKYRRILLSRRPPVTEVKDPPTLRASVPGVALERTHIARYGAVCGYGAASAAGSAVPVTYPHVISMPLHIAIFSNPLFPLRPLGLIHLTNVIEPLAPLTAGARVDVDVTAGNYRRLDAGLAFDMTTELTASGVPVWREICCFMARWPDPAAGGAGRPPRPPKAPRDATVLGERQVTLGTAWDYARVSADFNPIHLHQGAARKFGLRGAIMHGMWSLAYALAQMPPPKITLPGRIDTDFLTPVQLPAKVAAKEWIDDGRVRRALCDVRTGRVHMYAHWSAS